MSEKLSWTNDKRQLSDLVPWPRNPRTINDTEGKRLVESLDEFAQVETIAIGPDGEVYNGHQRLKVWIEEYGPDLEVDVRVSSRPLTEKEREKLTVLLHRGAVGEWDMELLGEWDNKEELVEWGFDPDEIGFKQLPDIEDDLGDHIDKADELRQKWQVERGQIWEIPSKSVEGKCHRVMCGDSTSGEDMELLMENKKASLCVTSPPYPGADMWSEDGEGALSRIKRLDGLNRQLLLSAWETVGEMGVVCWNVADVPFGNHGVVATTTTTTTACYEVGFLLRSIIIWDKGTPVLPPPAFMRRPAIAAIAHEHVLILYKGDWKPREKKCGIPTNDKQWLLKSVWPIATESAQRVGHRAPFPVELARRCIVLWSLDNDGVVDLCSGSGTTIVACEQTSRIGYGMEIEPKYVAVTLQRLSDLGLGPMLVTG